MPGGDTITQAFRREPRIGELLLDFAMRAICKRLGGHAWMPYGRPLPFGKREYCRRCRSNRVVLTADGSEHVATAMQVVAADTAFAEVLYEARWGEPPRHPIRLGEWPAT